MLFLFKFCIKVTYIADNDCWVVLFVDVSYIAKQYLTREAVIRNTPNDCCERWSKGFYVYFVKTSTQQYLTPKAWLPSLFTTKLLWYWAVLAMPWDSRIVLGSFAKLGTIFLRNWNQWEEYLHWMLNVISL